MDSLADLGSVRVGDHNPNAATGSRRPPHFPGFDGLRAIAAVSVLVFHCAAIGGFTSRSSLGVYTSRLDIGVSIFFLISGFLLYRPFADSHLTERSSPAVRKFWARRLLRIVPAYWLALTVLCYCFHAITLGPGWQGIVVHYGFMQIYFPSQFAYGINQAWSLCTEMSFYLVLPLYAALMAFRSRSKRAQLRRELIGLAVMVMVSFGFRWWALNLPLLTVRNGKFVATCFPNCSTRPAVPSLLVTWLPANLDLFALGMLLAVISAWLVEHDSEPSWLRSHWMPWVSWTCAAVTFVVVSQLVNRRVFLLPPGVNVARQTLYGLFALFLLLPAVFGHDDRSLIRRLLRSWPMVALGVISYGIYLWHFDLTREFPKWMGWQPTMVPFWILVSVVLGLAIAFASVSYFGLERPLLQVKDRILWWDRSAIPPAQRQETVSGSGQPPFQATYSSRPDEGDSHG